MDDTEWLRERGFRLGRSGLLTDLEASQRPQRRLRKPRGYAARGAPPAAAWLAGYLRDHGGRAPSAQVKQDGRAAGYCPAMLKRAMRPAGVTAELGTVPGKSGTCTAWVLAE